MVMSSAYKEVTESNSDFNSQQEPLLIFKENHSKQYVGTERKPQNTDQYFYVAWLNLYILLLDHWLEKEQTGFTNGNTIYRPWEADTERESASS